MKKIMNKMNFALIALMTAFPAFAEKEITSLDASKNGFCELIKQLHGIFDTLRILAFIGAAFYIAGWAWSYISGGDAKPDDIKKKGIALLVGFGLLFMIGIVLSFVLSVSGMELIGCADKEANLINW